MCREPSLSFLLVHRCVLTRPPSDALRGSVHRAAPAAIELELASFKETEAREPTLYTNMDAVMYRKFGTTLGYFARLSQLRPPARAVSCTLRRGVMDWRLSSN